MKKRQFLHIIFKYTIITMMDFPMSLKKLNAVDNIITVYNGK